MAPNGNVIERRESLVLLAGLLGLVALILIYNKPPLYDEDDYLRNVVLLQQYGFSETYLLKHIGSAGPLFPALHYILEPITKLETPYIRLVSVFLLLGSLWLTSLTLKTLQFSPSNAWLAFAIPMTYVISGMALTEIPAIFFLCASTYLIVRTSSSKKSLIKSAIWLSLAGLCLSLAILGRQPYLLILGALPILFFRRGNLTRNGGLFIITVVSALVLPGYVFSVWGGLVAPDDAALYDRIADEGTSLQPIFFFLCASYYAVIFFLIAPQFYTTPTTKEIFVLVATTLLLAFLNFKFGLFLFLPMRQLIEQTFPPIVSGWAEAIFGVVVFLGGAYFVIALVRQLIQHNFSLELLFFSAAVVLIAVGCMKITWGFSSRYPAQALPFLLPMFAYFYKRSRWNIYRLGTGVLLGLISFASYMMLN